MKNNELVILWTNADFLVSDMMVFMYAENSILNEWWGKVKIVIWGATTKLVVENEIIQDRIKDLKKVGVEFSSCETCANELGVKDDLIALDIEVKRWGKDLTELIKSNSNILTI